MAWDDCIGGESDSRHVLEKNLLDEERSRTEPFEAGAFGLHDIIESTDGLVVVDDDPFPFGHLE